MAFRMDSLKDSLMCPVCFEEFGENGDHVPRLLPCSHTLCHRCTVQVLKDKRLQCPTCRVKHEARREEISFPQNKYILILVRRRPAQTGELGKAERCLEHGEDKILFCRETECLKAICVSCLSQTHLGHKAVSIKEETKDVVSELLDGIRITSDSLSEKILDVTDNNQKAKEMTESCLEKLRRTNKKEFRNLRERKKNLRKKNKK